MILYPKLALLALEQRLPETLRGVNYHQQAAWGLAADASHGRNDGFNLDQSNTYLFPAITPYIYTYLFEERSHGTLQFS